MKAMLGCLALELEFELSPIVCHSTALGCGQNLHLALVIRNLGGLTGVCVANLE